MKINAQQGLYTTKLQAGLGAIEETKVLLSLWEPGMNSTALYQYVLSIGEFSNISARRLRNLITECFSPRFLNSGGYPANILKRLMENLSYTEFTQLLLIFTCRANNILADFIREVYWKRYLSGFDSINIDDARNFVLKGIESGKTTKPWADSTVRRVSSYLIGSCIDFGLLDEGSRREKPIIPLRIESKVSIFLAYDLHFSGVGDNAIMNHPDWNLFGMEKIDVLNEFKKNALKGFFILQAGGSIVKIDWNHKKWEELIGAIN
ncbi:BrxA family protein [Thalassobacillus devorans]|uniref:BrxA family protein n=1 Tax=Thalassobacillus devorans TaxID=279813 RepID=UPI00049220CC|nr:BrxA family protein [Thalassobacillus devorans]